MFLGALRGVLALSFVAVTCLAPTVGAADTAAVQAANAQTRINLAGRQRMLTQRMTKAVCLALPGKADAQWREQALAAAVTFEETLHGLRAGSPEAGLAPAQTAQERAALETVQEVSAAFTASVKQLASRDLHSVAMQIVIARNLTVLTRMNEAVGVIEANAGRGDSDPVVAATINQAGRQRMLSQRMAKNLCLLAVDLDRERSLKDLSQSAALFSDTLDGLLHGNAAGNLLAPPTPGIAAKLGQVSDMWRSLHPVIAQVQAQGTIGEAELLDAVAQLDRILVEMNAAVTLWAAYSGSS
ncbi:hypothetical protein FIU94_12395 [Sulfitobacter sp. THAF37]|nr:hypothetical protein FIU94_12395 [Sulfitobacter sp. THAF37]